MIIIRFATVLYPLIITGKVAGKVRKGIWSFTVKGPNYRKWALLSKVSKTLD